MSRSNEIIEDAMGVIKNATIPPTFQTILDLVEGHFEDFNEQDAAMLKNILPAFFGPMNGLRSIFNKTVGLALLKGVFPLDLFLLILEYKGNDLLEIYYGKYRHAGEHLKKVFSQSSRLEVNTFAKRDPWSNLQNPYVGVLESQHFTFSVYLNKQVVYFKTKQEKPDINEVWRSIVNYDTPADQLDNLKVWSSFAQQFPVEESFPLTFHVRVGHEDNEVFGLIKGWCAEIGIHNVIVDILPPGNNKIFLFVKKGPDMPNDYIFKAPCLNGDYPEPTMKVQSLLRPFVRGFKKPWHHERPMDDLKENLLELIGRVRARLAKRIFEKYTFPSPF